MLIRRTVIPALLLALAVAGCANADEAGPSGAPEPAASGVGTPPLGVPAPPSDAATPPAGDPAPSGIVDLPLPSKPVGGGKPAPVQTITGTLSAGVEPGCLLLSGSAGEYLLIIGDPAQRAAAKPGAKVTAVGTPDPGMMTTCQQGTPFAVTTLTPN